MQASPKEGLTSQNFHLLNRGLNSLQKLQQRLPGMFQGMELNQMIIIMTKEDLRWTKKYLIPFDQVK
jgi:hypothetical protein